MEFQRVLLVAFMYDLLLAWFENESFLREELSPHGWSLRSLFIERRRAFMRFRNCSESFSFDTGTDFHAWNRSRMLKNFPSYQRARISLQMAAEIWLKFLSCSLLFAILVLEFKVIVNTAFVSRNNSRSALLSLTWRGPRKPRNSQLGKNIVCLKESMQTN